jgi:hypothetical protein
MVKYSVSGGSRTAFSPRGQVDRNTDDDHTDDDNTEDRTVMAAATVDHNTAPDTSPTPSAADGEAGLWR